MLTAKNISVTLGEKVILHNLSVTLEPGLLHVILGPNGAGKTTLLKTLGGEINHYQGTVYYTNEDLKKISVKKLATQRAVLSQQVELNFPLTVEEVVMMGRYPHFDTHPTKKDYSICQDVLNELEISSFKGQNYLTLSGGEKQRVQFARILAQIWEPPANQGCRYLFLDEPLHSLDINFQHELLKKAKSLLKSPIVVVAIIHDLNLAFQYGDNLLLLKNGQLVAEGNPVSIAQKKVLEDSFGMSPTFLINPLTGGPLVVFQ